MQGGWNKDIFRHTGTQNILSHAGMEKLTETVFQKTKGVNQERKCLWIQKTGDPTWRRVTMASI